MVNSHFFILKRIKIIKFKHKNQNIYQKVLTTLTKMYNKRVHINNMYSSIIKTL